jgi:hypothetical protein
MANALWRRPDLLPAKERILVLRVRLKAKITFNLNKATRKLAKARKCQEIIKKQK